MNIFQLEICAVAVATFIFAFFIWLCDIAPRRASESCHKAHIDDKTIWIGGFRGEAVSKSEFEKMMKEQEKRGRRILPENRSMNCFYCDQENEGYCSKLRHHITNGYASLCHCKDCKDFICRKKE
jgi:hypothetical protein